MSLLTTSSYMNFLGLSHRAVPGQRVAGKCSPSAEGVPPTQQGADSEGAGSLGGSPHPTHKSSLQINTPWGHGGADQSLGVPLQPLPSSLAKTRITFALCVAQLLASRTQSRHARGCAGASTGLVPNVHSIAQRRGCYAIFQVQKLSLCRCSLPHKDVAKSRSQ